MILLAPLLCGAALVVGYVLVVAMAIPQLPEWAQPGVVEWMFDIPQNSEYEDNGASAAGQDVVPWEGYHAPDGNLSGLPLSGPIRHWGEWYEKPLLGCQFHDPFYLSHSGVDFPVDTGTPVITPMGGKVVWAGENGPWGLLVVVENNGYQVWLAHLEAISVAPGQILGRGHPVGLSGNTGNSTGPHLHFGVKHQTEDGRFVWLDPQQFFTRDDYFTIPCSD